MSTKEQQDSINADLYNKVNGLESKYDETIGYLRGVVESNERLIKLFARALYLLSVITLLSLGAIIFGAIGKDGLYSVRQVIPSTQDAIPAHNDFDNWKHKQSKGGTP
ncbi:MAG: hypothetical protein IIZ06_07755 [Kiritimatiellae bacterium]|nr:hypothetical protein [Kiritimatiellia bacterium]